MLISTNDNNNNRGRSWELHVHRSRFEGVRFFFSKKIIKLWNGLPESIVILICVKKSLKSYCKSNPYTLCIAELYFMLLFKYHCLNTLSLKYNIFA